VDAAKSNILVTGCKYTFTEICQPLLNYLETKTLWQQDSNLE